MIVSFRGGHKKANHKPKEKHFYRASQIEIKQAVEEVMPGLVYFI